MTASGSRPRLLSVRKTVINTPRVWAPRSLVARRHVRVPHERQQVVPVLLQPLRQPPRLGVLPLRPRQVDHPPLRPGLPHGVRLARQRRTLRHQPDRVAVQTPQGFAPEVLRRAHAAGADAAVTDDAMMCERIGVTVRTVEGSPDAFKVTRPQDLLIAEAILARSRV